MYIYVLGILVHLLRMIMATREVSCCGCDWIPPAKDHLTIGFAPKACSDDLTIGFAPRPAMIVFLAQNDTPLTLDLHKVVGKTLHYSPKAQRWFTGDKAHDRIRKNHQQNKSKPIAYQ